MSLTDEMRQQIETATDAELEEMRQAALNRSDYEPVFAIDSLLGSRTPSLFRTKGS